MKKKICYLMAGVMAVAFTFSACSDDDDKDLPKIDGYNDSDEVAEDNLVAHWTFDNTKAEDISGTEPDDEIGTVGFTEGQIGEALQLTKGALVYPSIDAIGGANSLSNYTVSMWVNTKNTGNTFTTFFGIFPETNTDYWGNLSLGAETGWFPVRAAGDTLVLKTNYMSLKDGGATNSQDNRPDPKGNPPVGVMKVTETWVHFVVRFNATTHMLEIYGNGVSVGAYSNRGEVTTALVMRTPAIAMFGSLSTKTVGANNTQEMPDWQELAVASIDDVRVFNTALATTEITALYNLGLAGR